MKTLMRFLKDERGLELSEYAIMAALVIIIAVAAISAVGTAIQGKFNELETQINTPVGS